MSYEENQVLFDKLEKWLVNHKYKIWKKDINPTPGIAYNLITHLPKNQRFYINITLFTDTKNYLFFNRNVGFDDVAKKSVNALPRDERELLFMNIRKLVYPLFVNLEMKWPKAIFLFKEITFESIENNEQFFIDQVRNLINAIELVKINFDEKHFSIFKEGRKSPEEFR